ncbi:hypothetical protein [Tardiphaga sp.]|uniref:hypothetical protein n=1 Tax=Tardiphaga sp. TaxID=1926292 RepID=UPI002605AE48|nr:hypothetical protein [Tardiphaga sp.]MDB5617578.1 outer rane autotransporter [Tardiphaga sp.]
MGGVLRSGAAAVAKNWTVRTEANYFNMGTERYDVAAVPALSGFAVDVKQAGFISTVGVDYHSALTLVTAKY